MVTKAEIVTLLKTNDKAIARALVALNERQTASEQVQETVISRNGEGFRPCHARMGTSMANFFSRFGYLSPKQVAYWRKLDRTGKMRIEIYAGQLLIVAQAKAATKAILAPKVAAVADKCAGPVGDVGNMQEELMVLEEQLSIAQYEFNDTLDADDEKMTRGIAERIVHLTTRIEDLRKEVARAYAEMA
jgi:hypothetical protein